MRYDKANSGLKGYPNQKSSIWRWIDLSRLPGCSIWSVDSLFESSPPRLYAVCFNDRTYSAPSFLHLFGITGIIARWHIWIMMMMTTIMIIMTTLWGGCCSCIGALTALLHAYYISAVELPTSVHLVGTLRFIINCWTIWCWYSILNTCSINIATKIRRNGNT